MTVRPRILVLGGGGKVARLLAGTGFPGAADVLWQSRRVASGIDWVCDPLQCGADAFAAELRALECDAVLVLWGATPGASEAALNLNTTLAEIALEGARAAGVPHVILASSIAVYGGVLALGDAVTEDTPPQATVGYGAAKLDMERLARTFTKEHAHDAPGVSILRLANVLGADQLSSAMLSGEPVLLDQFADGSGPKRSFLAPTTLARAVVGLAADPPLRGDCEILNLADGSEARDMADVLRAAQSLGQDITWHWKPASPSALACAAMSVAKMEARAPDFAPFQFKVLEDLVQDWIDVRGSLGK